MYSKTFDELNYRLLFGSYSDFTEEIEAVAAHGSVDDRCTLAQVLGHYKNRHAEKMLLAFLSDNNQYVRLVAAESLGSYWSSEVYETIRAMPRQRSPHFRGSLAWALAKNVPSDKKQEAVDILRAMFEAERDTNAKIWYVMSLLLLDCRDYEEKLAPMFSRSDYQHRCEITDGLAILEYECGITVDPDTASIIYRKAVADRVFCDSGSFERFCASYGFDAKA